MINMIIIKMRMTMILIIIPSLGNFYVLNFWLDDDSILDWILEKGDGPDNDKPEGDKPKNDRPEEEVEDFDYGETDEELERDILEEIEGLSKLPQTNEVKTRIKGLQELLIGNLTPAKPPVPLYDPNKGDWVKKP